jgi:hypothetical protein
MIVNVLCFLLPAAGSTERINAQSVTVASLRHDFLARSAKKSATDCTADIEDIVSRIFCWNFLRFYKAVNFRSDLSFLSNCKKKIIVVLQL